jgi:hypothetical protein
VCCSTIDKPTAATERHLPMTEGDAATANVETETVTVAATEDVHSLSHSLSLSLSQPQVDPPVPRGFLRRPVAPDTATAKAEDTTTARATPTRSPRRRGTLLNNEEVSLSHRTNSVVQIMNGPSPLYVHVNHIGMTNLYNFFSTGNGRSRSGQRSNGGVELTPMR